MLGISALNKMSIAYLVNKTTKTKTTKTKTKTTIKITKTVKTKTTTTKTKIIKTKNPIASLGQIRRFQRKFAEEAQQNPYDENLRSRFDEYTIKLQEAEIESAKFKHAKVKTAIAIAKEQLNKSIKPEF